MDSQIKAWYMDTSDPTKDQRDDHKYNPSKNVSLEDLKKETGVLHYYIPMEDSDRHKEGSRMNKICTERGYSYEDMVDIKPGQQPRNEYEGKLKKFFEEHLHADEEIRYCEDGSGYFDVRDSKDQWIRILMEPGDMIILPAGIYHRFTLDTNNYIKARRYFVGEPVWTPHNRPADNHPARADYMQRFQGQQQCLKA